MTTEKMIQNICQLFHSVTKMDARWVTPSGKEKFAITHHSIPQMIENFNDDFIKINETLKNVSKNTFHYYINRYALEFLAAPYWKDEEYFGFILIGPFISSTGVIDSMNEIISGNKLPISKRNKLIDFYKSLTVISKNEYHSIGQMLINLCQTTLKEAEIVTTEMTQPPINKEKVKENVYEEEQLIEYRYSLEKKVMEAIASGDNEKLSLYFEGTDMILDFSNRFPNSPIRSAKNIAIVLNTLCRVAAERGNVHPVYIHTISEKFAILIEKAPNLPRLESLCLLMVNEYCDLVKEYSTKNLSPIVKRTVDYIRLHLEQPLQLQEIAEALHISPSHLSRKFKEEMDITVTEFINKCRVEEAKFYLQKRNASITEVAFLVGFNDLNYFSKVFKKYTTMTPTQFIKKNRK